MRWFDGHLYSVEGRSDRDLHENPGRRKARHLRIPYSAQHDPEVTDVLRFLWQREIVHFQLFGETDLVQEHLNHRHYFYAP